MKHHIATEIAKRFLILFAALISFSFILFMSADKLTIVYESWLSFVSLLSVLLSAATFWAIIIDRVAEKFSEESSETDKKKRSL